MTPVKYLKGVGEFRASLLEKIGVVSINDLLELFPKSYIQQSFHYHVQEDDIDTYVSMIADIYEAKERRTNSGSTQYIVTLFDGNQFIDCIWFQYGKWITKVFQESSRVWVAGMLGNFNGKYQLIHPQYEVLNERETLNDFWKSRNVLPVYPAVANLSQSLIRNIIYNAFEMYHESIDETLSEEIIKSSNYQPRKVALQKVHFTLNPEHIEEIKDRFVFEELFYQQLMMLNNRSKREHAEKKHHFSLTKTYTGLLMEKLPFQLTNAQKRVIEEIFSDMCSEKQMNRLLQGDVGSGKTIVCLFAMLLAKENNYQSVLLAPTEILAEQHFKTISSLTEGMPDLKIGLLTGGVSKAKNELKKQISNGEVDIVVGTHALIQKTVNFKNLGFIAVDEQHRFGVQQRADLSIRHDQPEILYLSATPIPRSLALTVFGELDVSILNELPPTRKPIKTKWIREHDKAKAYVEIEKEIIAGRQIYIVCPLIEESEKSDLMAAETLLLDMQRKYFPQYISALLHGKMKNQYKDEVMNRFKNNEIQILISTTVIEVGIDVPNASVMMVEHAERFGLAQLHQLRGRVGRGADQSYCYLVSYRLSEIGKERLKVMERTNDGFVIAEKDLELRGPGEFFGKQQSGLPAYKFANLVLHQDCLKRARIQAEDIIERDPEFSDPQNEVIRKNYELYYAHKENLLDY